MAMTEEKVRAQQHSHRTRGRHWERARHPRSSGAFTRCALPVQLRKVFLSVDEDDSGLLDSDEIKVPAPPARPAPNGR